MLNSKRSFAAATVLGEKIYVVGGYDGESDMRSVECYDQNTDKWTNVADLNVARCSHRCCTVRGYIYAVCGIPFSNYRSTIEKYDEQINQWKIVSYFLSLCIRIINYYNNNDLYKCWSIFANRSHMASIYRTRALDSVLAKIGFTSLVVHLRLMYVD